MKQLLFSLVLFSVLFVIGCQESSITDPISTEPINKDQAPGTNVTRGTIPLEGILVAPGFGQNYYSIEGRINYSHELVFLDPIPPAPQYFVDLVLSVNATLTNDFQSGHNTWNISTVSDNVVYVSEDGIRILEKSFPVLGRNDGMVLVCRFLVTTDGVGLNAKWLAFSNGDGINKIGLPQDTLTYPPVKIDNYQ